MYKITHFTLYSSNGDSKVKTAAVDDTSPIASKKSRKRKILDDSEGEEEADTSVSVSEKNDVTSANSPSSDSVTATVSDVDLPCSSASLQQSPDVLSTPPKRLTGITRVYVRVCVRAWYMCAYICLSVYVCLSVHILEVYQLGAADMLMLIDTAYLSSHTDNMSCKVNFY